MIQQLAQALRNSLPELTVLEQEPMKKHITFRVGGPADLYVCPTVDQLPKVLELAKEYQVPVTMIGNGSNLLVSDTGIRGLVVEMGKAAETLSLCGNRLYAGAGTLLSKAANLAAENDLGGMEFAAGIPGSVGGAVVMNAGAYGGEIKDILLCAELLTPEGEKITLTGAEMELSYRHSCVPEKGYIVLGAWFELEKKPEEEIRALMADLKNRRQEKQPLEYPSAGSTFKRPEGYFAGKLIQDAGLRGYRVGDAQVSEKHCGFVINRGEATAAEILQLIRDVQDKVFCDFGVKLETEVKMLGEFE